MKSRTILVALFSLNIGCTKIDVDQKVDVDQEVLNLHKTIMDMSGGSATLTISYTGYSYDYTPPATTSYVDENGILQIVYSCTPSCQNTGYAITLILDKLKHIPCSEKTIYRSKFYFTRNKEIMDAFYIGNYGKELKFQQICFKSDTKIRFYSGEMKFF